MQKVNLYIAFTNKIVQLNFFPALKSVWNKGATSFYRLPLLQNDNFSKCVIWGTY